MAFESLDFIYHPSRDPQRDLTYFIEVLGGRLADCPRVALGAVKSMIGHCIPAAGMAGQVS